MSDDNIFLDIYNSVSDYRKRKTDKYLFRKDKNLSLCAEYLLKCACNDYCIDYDEQTLAFNGESKPTFLNSNIFFNISHSEERAMCVMSHLDVGCDIEKIRTFDIRTAERFFTEEETDIIRNCRTDEEKNTMFYSIWTLKESYLKCTGTGITVPLDSVSFVLNGKIKNLITDGENIYCVYSGKIDDNYMYSLCVRKEKNEKNDYDFIKKHIYVEKIILN